MNIDIDLIKTKVVTQMKSEGWKTTKQMSTGTGWILVFTKEDMIFSTVLEPADLLEDQQ